VPPVRLETLSGVETAVFSFTTDIPFLDRWGRPLLLGPGSVIQAHTADEHVDIAELLRATSIYADLADRLR
jgi:acetylornithine deacetylase